MNNREIDMEIIKNNFINNKYWKNINNKIVIVMKNADMMGSDGNEYY